MVGQRWDIRGTQLRPDVIVWTFVTAGASRVGELKVNWTKSYAKNPFDVHVRFQEAFA
jgi:hypothetical protein